MAIVARVTCTHVDTYEVNERVFFIATNKTNGDNKDFTKYTPIGNAEFHITDDAPAFGKFKPGKDYELVFNELK